MSTTKSESPFDWMPVRGRSMAVLCLHAEDLRGSTLLDQWLFLDRLGLSRDEAARVLGTSAETLRVAAARRKTQESKSAK